MINLTKLLPSAVVLLTIVQCIKFEFGPCLLQYLEPCSEEVIQYYLFSSDHPLSAPILLNSKTPTIPEPFNLYNKTNKLIVHGYGGHLDFYATKAIRDGE